MILRFFQRILLSQRTKRLKILRIFFRLRKYFTNCKSMAYTENLGLRHYVGFSQIRCHSGMCFPEFCVSRTHITRDPCFPAHISQTGYRSTSHSDICFPGYYVPQVGVPRTHIPRDPCFAAFSFEVH